MTSNRPAREGWEMGHPHHIATITALRREDGYYKREEQQDKTRQPPHLQREGGKKPRLYTSARFVNTSLLEPGKQKQCVRWSLIRQAAFVSPTFASLRRFLEAVEGAR